MLIIFTIARLIAAGMLAWALVPHPNGYYQVLRVVVSTVCVLGVYCANKWNLHDWILAFGWVVILFNPVYPVPLPVAAWKVIDVVIAIFMVASLFLVTPSSTWSRNKRKQLARNPN